MYCDACRKAGADNTDKIEFVTEKTWKSCLLNKSLKHVGIDFCLIQGINNYLQINTYWSCIVRIGIFINLASNILLLASKDCFLTSQG
jgi:hypothetical protein